MEEEEREREEITTGTAATRLPTKKRSAEKLALSVAPETAILITLCWEPHIMVTRMRRTRA